MKEVVEVIYRDKAAEVAGEDGSAAMVDIGYHFLQHGAMLWLGDARVCDYDHARRVCGEVLQGSGRLACSLDIGFGRKSVQQPLVHVIEEGLLVKREEEDARLSAVPFS
jgi:hypothetical protein